MSGPLAARERLTAALRGPAAPTAPIAGLDLDYRGQPFEPIPYLLALADSITKLSAVCVVCGGAATRSHRVTDGDARFAVGGADTYEARCRVCSVL